MAEPPAGRPTASIRVEPRHVAAFRRPLRDWFAAARRPMPWRAAEPGRRDPYRTWVSEVMLQQTRVEQAGPYFERFVAHYPTVDSLAAAPLEEVLRSWEGLGYYARARNLHRAAAEVVERHGGIVPSEGAAFRALPGVGAYTAAAVLSIAHGRPLAALDGNVVRVLARVFAVREDARSARTRAALQRTADQLLDLDDPGRHNEALMELGAVVCTPRGPDCEGCPLGSVCEARRAGRQADFPVLARKPPVPHVRVAVGVVGDDAGRVLVQRRPDDAMLGGLWEFPGGKSEPGETPADTCRRELAEEVGLAVEVGEELARVDHAYSHFRVSIHAFRCIAPAAQPRSAAGQPIRWATLEELADMPMPRANRRIVDALAREAVPA